MGDEEAKLSENSGMTLPLSGEEEAIPWLLLVREHEENDPIEIDCFTAEHPTKTRSGEGEQVLGQ
jgi:hypothetical protein